MVATSSADRLVEWQASGATGLRKSWPGWPSTCRPTQRSSLAGRSPSRTSTPSPAPATGSTGAARPIRQAYGRAGARWAEDPDERGSNFTVVLKGRLGSHGDDQSRVPGADGPGAVRVRRCEPGAQGFLQS